MMAAYAQQPMQPGMQHGHPGMAPHMQHMGQPMMQPGVSGPGQPHVSQAGAMMGMQPGSNGPMNAMQGGQPGMGMPGQGMGGQSMAGGAPNQQALSHMNQQQMMHLQQMQAQQQGNPQLIAQHQRMMQQRAMQAQAQAQANGMMGMQQGGAQGLTPQQMAMFQQGNAGGHPGAVQLPPHLQQQMQMQQAMRAQQNHQQQQMQQQQLAMQHANSQQSNQGQPGPPNQQGQPGHPPQMRPQSRMANPNQPAQGPQQQPPQQDQQGPPSQGTPQQNQQPNQQQGQQPGMNSQQMQARQMAMMQQRQQQQFQHQQRLQQVQQQAQQQAQQQQTRAGTFILRINLLCDHISNFDSTTGKEIGQWNEFVDRHFATDGRLLHSFNDNPNNKTRTFEVLRPTIARYFFTYFESGAQSLRLHAEHARETPMSNGRYQVSCSTATLSVSYASGARLEMTGSLNALFAPGLDIIDCLEIQQTGTEETISRAGIERVLSSWSPTMDTKSPKMAKNKLPKAQQKLQQQMNGLTIDSFPKAPKGTMGVTSRVQQFLELGETMNLMSELMHFSQDKKLRPEQALEVWLAQNEPQQSQQGNAPHLNLPPNGANRTPSMQHMQMPGQGGPQGNYSSPSVSNLNLPMQNGLAMNGSPHIANNPGLAPNMGGGPNSHTPSPHISNMAAPPMVPQHSQQGTNSSAASANTSPQVNVKRRRSQVKLEDDSGAPEGGPPPSQRMKQSPSIRKKGKPGGPAG